VHIIFKLPILTGSNRLDQFVVQFEAAVDSDFPNYQVFFLTWHLNFGLRHLGFLGLIWA